MLWRLCPTLLKQGYVFVAKSPLFKVSYGKKGDKRMYFYNESDKDDFVNSLREKNTPNIEVSRFKGLGEMQPEDMEETIMNPKTRKLIQIEYPENEEELTRICYGLMGDDIVSRKMWIDAYFNSVEAIIE